MRELTGEIVYAWRRLRSAPAFTLFSVVTLALGIGATTAIYSVVHAAVLRPPAIRDVGRVASIYHMDPRRGGSGPMIGLSAPDYQDYRDAQSSFGSLAAWSRFRQALVANGVADIVTGEIFRMQRKDEAYGRRILEQMLAAARRLPGVEAAALSSGFPIEIGTPGASVSVVAADGSTHWMRSVAVDFLVSTPGIFDTLGVGILRGRGFDERDSAGAEPVVLLSERLARELFPDASPIGRRVALRRNQWVGEPVHPLHTLTVIGVAEDTDSGVTGRRVRSGAVYRPLEQHYEPAMTLTARTSGDPAALVEPLRRSVRRIDPDLALLDAGTGVVLGGAGNVLLKVGAAASALLGGLALVLAMAGLYGVLSEIVLRRTRELGIRMALGADGARLLRMVLLDGTRPVLAGLAIGLGCGIVLRVAFRPMFVRLLPAFDPWILAIVPVPFILAAVVAAYAPARRAARVDPNVALRHL